MGAGEGVLVEVDAVGGGRGVVVVPGGGGSSQWPAPALGGRSGGRRQFDQSHLGGGGWGVDLDAGEGADGAARPQRQRRGRVLPVSHHRRLGGRGGRRVDEERPSAGPALEVEVFAVGYEVDPVPDHEATGAPELTDRGATRGVLVEHQHPERAEVDQGLGPRFGHPDSGAAGPEVVDGGVRALDPRRVDAGDDELDRDPGGAGQDHEVVQCGHELGGGGFQFRVAGQRPAERPREVGAGGDGDGFTGEVQGAVGAEQAELDVVVRGERLATGLVAVDEDHPGGPVRADGPPQGVPVVEVTGRLVGFDEPHRREAAAGGRQEVVLQPEGSVGGADLPVLAQRRLEVVADHGQVVGVSGVQRLLHSGRGVGDMGAAVVHVVALPGRPGSDLGQREGGDVVRVDQRSTVVGGLDAAAELAGGERVAVEGRPGSGGGLETQVGPHGVVVPQFGEEEVPPCVAGPAGVRVVPGRLRVSGVEREELVRGQFRGAPGGGGPQRGGDPGVAREVFEGPQVFRLVVEFVLDLDGHDGAALGVVEAGQLLADPCVVGADEVEVGRVVGAGAGSRAHDPVREPAVACLAVRPGADAHHGVHAALADQPHEGAQVPVAVEPEFPTVLLVVVPEQVGGHDGHTTGAHVEQSFPPGRARAPGEVDLAHDGEPGTSTAHEVGAGRGDPVRGPVGLAHPEMAGQRCHDRA